MPIYAESYYQSPIYVQKIVDITVEREGGYINNPDDSGKETNHGVTIATARRLGYTGSMRSLPKSEAKDMLTYEYYYKHNLDSLYKLSPLLTKEVFDAGVLSGVKRPVEWLQTILNVFNNKGKLYHDLVVDGSLGRKTEVALKHYLNYRGKDGEKVLYNALNCLQGEFFITLSSRREKDETFVYGWMRNRLDFI